MRPNRTRIIKTARTATASASAAAILAVSAIWAMPAQSASLNEALSAAYRYNPRIDAERARLRATDEGVSQAMGGYRPNIGATADTAIVDQRARTRDEDVGTGTFIPGVGTFGGSGARAGDTIYPRGYSISVQQNLFDGFQTTNRVSEAEANVRAGREILRDIERNVLLEAATAYMDVVRDQAIVRLQENNVSVLSRELQATQDRFSVGEVTRTDVAQARARRAGAVSALDLARANLKTSRASYVRVVGSEPMGVSNPRLPTRLIPRGVQSAISIGLNESPTIIASLYLEQASRHTVDRIRGELLPSVTLEANYTNRFHTSSSNAESENTSLTGRVNIPIYQQGIVSSRVRQAKHTHVSRLQEIEEARTLVRQGVVSAWSRYEAALAQLESDRTQVDANRTALTGVREEEKVGQRTLLDVLNAEQELLNSQVQFETTQRDLIVAAYTVLAAIGRLDAVNIGVASTVYDPEEHYTDVRRKWWGISITHRDGREERMELWDTHGKSYK